MSWLNRSPTANDKYVFTKEKSEVCSDQELLNNEAPSLITSVEYIMVIRLNLNENERLLMPRNSHYTYFNKHINDDAAME